MMGKFRDFIAVWLMGGIGLLLTLSGLKLIQLSSDLVLYSGAALLILAALINFLPKGKGGA